MITKIWPMIDNKENVAPYRFQGTAFLLLWAYVWDIHNIY